VQVARLTEMVTQMTAKRRLSADELRSVLRRGDPARDDGLTPDESSELHRRVLAGDSLVTTSLGRRWVRVTGMAVVVVALVVLVAGSGRLTRTTHAPLVASGSSATRTSLNSNEGASGGAPSRDGGLRGSITATPGADDSRQPDTASQRVFVTTPGGTRIVWVLNPRFAF